MKFYVLASGSKGNCTVIKDQGVEIVIDCGTTNRHLTQSFHKIGVDYKSVDALLITHTHSDHIGRLKLFEGVPTYTPEHLDINGSQTIVTAYERFEVKHLSIIPIELSHDSSITLGYIISNGTEKLVYVTDTGYFKDADIDYITNATHYIFESNHDPTLLMETNRPYFIKQRILSMNGHLSNEDAAHVLRAAIGDQTQEIILAHLSEEANHPEIALATAQEIINCDKIEIKVAKQFDIVEGGSNEE